MARLILLDSGPLGLMIRAPGKPHVVRCLTWLRTIDADAILAGQAAFAGQPGDHVIIATTNLAHLNRFPGITAQAWDQIG